MDRRGAIGLPGAAELCGREFDRPIISVLRFRSTRGGRTRLRRSELQIARGGTGRRRRQMRLFACSAGQGRGWSPVLPLSEAGFGPALPYSPAGLDAKQCAPAKTMDRLHQRGTASGSSATNFASAWESGQGPTVAVVADLDLPKEIRRGHNYPKGDWGSAAGRERPSLPGAWIEPYWPVGEQSWQQRPHGSTSPTGGSTPSAAVFDRGQRLRRAGLASPEKPRQWAAGNQRLLGYFPARPAGRRKDAAIANNCLLAAKGRADRQRSSRTKG